MPEVFDIGERAWAIASDRSAAALLTTATDAVHLLPDVLTIAATTNETKTTLSDNKITVGLSTDIIVSGGATVSNNLHVIGN